MRRDSLLLLGLLTTICLIAGLVAGIQSGKFVAVPPQARPTVPRASETGGSTHGQTSTPVPNLLPTLSARQMAIMIVGVADANAPHPKFEGCWIVAFSPGINQYYVLVFPPQSRFNLASIGSNQTLADIYTQDVQQELGYRFMRDAIQSIFPAMTVQAAVTFDRGDLADLASKLGGIPLGGRLLLGDSLAAAYDSQLFNGTSARLEFQRQTFEAIFQALDVQNWSPASVAWYLQQLPHPVRPEDSTALTTLAESAPSLQNSELTWTVVGGVHETASVP
jgi:hypothetical protein